MKKLLFLPLVLVACFCLAQDAKEIIGKPIKIGNLFVAENDFPDAMNWDDAKKACRALGKGWRLPSLSELTIMYKRRDKIENIGNYLYWSLSGKTFGRFSELASPSDAEDKSNKYIVRAVKSL
jgi:hypothetical protein